MSGADRNGYILIGAMSDYEIAAIREHWLTHTDKEIGEMLGRPWSSIRNYRRTQNLVKPTRGAKKGKPQPRREKTVGEFNPAMQAFLSGRLYG
jgi:hypothetical protein